MMEELRRYTLTDEETEQFAGGTNAESQEILNYIRDHDPNGYASIQSSRNPYWAALRYLYNKGVPVVLFTPSDTSGNSYYVGDPNDLDHAKKVSPRGTDGHDPEDDLITIYFQRLRTA